LVPPQPLFFFFFSPPLPHYSPLHLFVIARLAHRQRRSKSIYNEVICFSIPLFFLPSPPFFFLLLLPPPHFFAAMCPKGRSINIFSTRLLLFYPPLFLLPPFFLFPPSPLSRRMSTVSNCSQKKCQFFSAFSLLPSPPPPFFFPSPPFPLSPLSLLRGSSGPKRDFVGLPNQFYPGLSLPSPVSFTPSPFPFFIPRCSPIACLGTPKTIFKHILFPFSLFLLFSPPPSPPFSPLPFLFPFIGNNYGW